MIWATFLADISRAAFLGVGCAHGAIIPSRADCFNNSVLRLFTVKAWRAWDRVSLSSWADKSVWTWVHVPVFCAFLAVVVNWADLAVIECICRIGLLRKTVLESLFNWGVPIVQVSSCEAWYWLDVVTPRTVKAKRTFVAWVVAVDTGDGCTVAVVTAFARQAVINAACIVLTLVSTDGARYEVLRVHGAIASRRTILWFCIVVSTIIAHLADCTLTDLLCRIGESPSSRRASGHIKCSFLTIVPLWASESFVLDVWLMPVCP